MTEQHGRKRHSPEQIIAKLGEADAILANGLSIGQVCQKLEVSELTPLPRATHATPRGIKFPIS